MRNDILIRKIMDFATGTQDFYLVFEGKSRRGDSLDQAARQLLDFVMASPKLSGAQSLWGIVARGASFRLMFYSNGGDTSSNYKNRIPTTRIAASLPQKPFPTTL